MAHSKTKNFPELFLNSDIIISAVGKAEFFDERYFSKNKNPIIIDVGINQDDNKRTVGDFNFLKVKSFTSAITPVPGGIGPMTVISLMENLLLAVKKQNERNL
jgi:methylenetetrahydrofolate dehydrogenase (NADP+)/methenyltetrahydrofolate cyclohydrolase